MTLAATGSTDLTLVQGLEESHRDDQLMGFRRADQKPTVSCGKNHMKVAGIYACSSRLSPRSFGKIICFEPSPSFKTIITYNYHNTHVGSRMRI